MSEREPKKAYAVSYGEYSDYCVAAIFDTRERAELYLGDQGRVRYVGQDCWNKNEEWWSPPEHPSEDYGYRIEEFDYYDGDVLPLSDMKGDDDFQI